MILLEPSCKLCIFTFCFCHTLGGDGYLVVMAWAPLKRWEVINLWLKEWRVSQFSIAPHPPKPPELPGLLLVGRVLPAEYFSSETVSVPLASAPVLSYLPPTIRVPLDSSLLIARISPCQPLTGLKQLTKNSAPAVFNSCTGVYIALAQVLGYLFFFYLCLKITKKVVEKEQKSLKFLFPLNTGFHLPKNFFGKAYILLILKSTRVISFCFPTLFIDYVLNIGS